MSDRRRQASNKNRMKAYIAAGVVHAVIIGAMIFNFTSKPKTVDAAYADKVDVVKATVIDESEIKKQQDKLERKERERERKEKREQDRLKKLKENAKKEEKRIKELKEAAEREKNKAIALEKKKEDERKKREAKKKREQEAKLKKEEQERIAEEQRALEAKRELDESIAAEEAFRAERRAQQRTTTLISKHSALIKRKVTSFRTIAPDFERWRVAEVNIKLSPLGEVQDARIVKSSGSARYDKSVVDAVLKASPLPIPSFNNEPAANKEMRDIILKFPMPGAG